MTKYTKKIFENFLGWQFSSTFFSSLLSFPILNTQKNKKVKKLLLCIVFSDEETSEETLMQFCNSINHSGRRENTQKGRKEFCYNDFCCFNGRFAREIFEMKFNYFSFSNCWVWFLWDWKFFLAELAYLDIRKGF